VLASSQIVLSLIPFLIVPYNLEEKSKEFCEKNGSYKFKKKRHFMFINGCIYQLWTRTIDACPSACGYVARGTLNSLLSDFI
jgi:hypothetical protein